MRTMLLALFCAALCETSHSVGVVLTPVGRERRAERRAERLMRRRAVDTGADARFLLDASAAPAASYAATYSASMAPSLAPSSASPSAPPAYIPSYVPSTSPAPGAGPSFAPSAAPSSGPAFAATPAASFAPSFAPSSAASSLPGPYQPSAAASYQPSAAASFQPSAGAAAPQPPTATASPTVTPSITASPTARVSPGLSQSNTASVSLTGTPTVTPSATASRTITRTPTSSLSPGASASKSGTSSRTNSKSNTGTPTGTASITRTATITPSPTARVSEGLSQSITPTTSPSPSGTPSITATLTPTRTGTRSPTATKSTGASASVTSTNSAYPSNSGTNLPSATNTRTPSTTPSAPGGTPSPTVSTTPSAALITKPLVRLAIDFSTIATDPLVLGTLSETIAAWLSLDSTAVASWVPYKDDITGAAKGFTFVFLVDPAVVNSIVSANAEARRRLDSTTDAGAALGTLMTSKLNDGSLPVLVAAAGLVSSLGFESADSLMTGINVPPVVIALPSVTSSVSPTVSPTPTRPGVLLVSETSPAPPFPASFLPLYVILAAPTGAAPTAAQALLWLSNFTPQVLATLGFAMSLALGLPNTALVISTVTPVFNASGVLTRALQGTTAGFRLACGVDVGAAGSAYGLSAPADIASSLTSRVAQQLAAGTLLTAVPDATAQYLGYASAAAMSSSAMVDPANPTVVSSAFAAPSIPIGDVSATSAWASVVGIVGIAGAGAAAWWCSRRHAAGAGGKGAAGQDADSAGAVTAVQVVEEGATPGSGGLVVRGVDGVAVSVK